MHDARVCLAAPVDILATAPGSTTAIPAGKHKYPGTPSRSGWRAGSWRMRTLLHIGWTSAISCKHSRSCLHPNLPPLS